MTDSTGEIEVRMPPREPHPLPAVRRVLGGCAYDTTTASVLWHGRGDDDPDAGGMADQWGGVLLVNRWGHYFALEYNYCWDPWTDNYEKLVPLTTARAVIEWMEPRCNWLIEEIFGRMAEAGQGEPYTPAPVEP